MLATSNESGAFCKMSPSRPKESSKFWMHPALPSVELLRATFVTHRFSRHIHDGYALGVIECGQEGFQYRGTSYVAPAGSIAIIQPGEVHTGHAATEDGWRYRMFYPDAAVLMQVAEQIGGGSASLPYFADPVIWDLPLAQGLQQLHRTLETGDSAIACESEFLWTLANLILRHGRDRPTPAPLASDPSRMDQVRAYLDTHLAESISLEDLARLTQRSPFQVLRAFRQQFGLPPHAYLTQRRVVRAKQLLAQQRAIAQVAAETGFTDQSHLARHFKRIVGITPGQYQRGYRVGSAMRCKNVQDFAVPHALA